MSDQEIEKLKRAPTIFERIIGFALGILSILFFGAMSYVYMVEDFSLIGSLITLTLFSVSVLFLYRVIFTPARELTENETRKAATAMKWARMIRKILGSLE